VNAKRFFGMWGRMASCTPVVNRPHKYRRDLRDLHVGQPDSQCVAGAE
jgi:hypothetical protein